MATIDPQARVSLCPDCGGRLNESYEHEWLYRMICPSCEKWFAFYTESVKSPDDQAPHTLHSQGAYGTDIRKANDDGDS